MDIPNKKRPRSQNWDDGEKRLFLEFLKEEVHVVENKKKLTVLNKDKLAAWERVAKKMEVEVCNTSFLSNGFSLATAAAFRYPRDIKRIKEQWLRMKIAAKKNIAHYRILCNKTGGGPPPPAPTDMDWFIKSLIPHEFFEDTAAYDSDALLLTQDNNEEETSSPKKKILLNYNSEALASSSTNTDKQTTDDLGVESETVSEEEEIHIIVNDFNNCEEQECLVKETPKKSKEYLKKMSAYEHKLYELNKERIVQSTKESAEMHALRIQHEKEYHQERMRLLRERGSDVY